jgi:hypothetical protein
MIRSMVEGVLGTPTCASISAVCWNVSRGGLENNCEFEDSF